MENQDEIVDGRIARLVLAIGTEIHTRRGIMGAMNLSGRRSWRVYHLNPAIEQGYVKMVFPSSPNSPDQAYRLTAKGIELYRTLKDLDPNSTK